MLPNTLVYIFFANLISFVRSMWPNFKSSIFVTTSTLKEYRSRITVSFTLSHNWTLHIFSEVRQFYGIQSTSAFLLLLSYPTLTVLEWKWHYALPFVPFEITKTEQYKFCFNMHINDTNSQRTLGKLSHNNLLIQCFLVTSGTLRTSFKWIHLRYDEYEFIISL